MNDTGNTPQKVHLMGICGTAMAALAGSLQARGMRVTGSDSNVYPPMSDHLAALGIQFAAGYAPENIPPDTDLVVVGNVISESNPEAAEMRRRGLPFLSMAEAVKRFAIEDRTCVAVVGTHGKTTTTSLAAHVLTGLGLDPGFLIGGIARNFGSNFRLGPGAVFVIEGDEYDTAYFDKTPKFFKYRPDIVIFTSCEFDHADIYADLDAIKGQFGLLLESLPADGLVIACADDPNVVELLPRASCPVLTYGFSAGAEIMLAGWRPLEGSGGEHRPAAEFSLAGEQWTVPMAGSYNALNAAAVIAMARELEKRGLAHKGLTAHSGASNTASPTGGGALQDALSSFLGVKRRQEVRGEAGGVMVMDDFAHHPTAVALTIAGIRKGYPGRRVWAVFEPRSFTARTARFQDDFGRALAGAERVVLARPFTSSYSEGQQYLDSEALAGTLRAQGVWAEAPGDTTAIITLLARHCRPGDIVLIMSNGGFDNIHQRLLESLGANPGDVPAENRRETTDGAAADG